MSVVQVLYGMDYTANQREQQEGLLRAAILKHIKAAPQSREKLCCSLGQPRLSQALTPKPSQLSLL